MATNDGIALEPTRKAQMEMHGADLIQNARNPIDAAIARLGYVLRYVYHDQSNYERAVKEAADRLRSFPKLPGVLESGPAPEQDHRSLCRAK